MGRKWHAIEKVIWIPHKKGIINVKWNLGI